MYFQQLPSGEGGEGRKKKENNILSLGVDLVRDQKGVTSFLLSFLSRRIHILNNYTGISNLK